MGRIGFLLAAAALLLPGCQRAPDQTEQIQDASAKPIVGAFGKKLGQRWPDPEPGTSPRVRSDLYVFPFEADNPLPGMSRHFAWVLPATMKICRLTASGDLGNDNAFAEFFQKLEGRFGRLAPLRPAESFRPPRSSYWSASNRGRTLLVVRRTDGRTTVDLFDIFLGSRPLDEILSAKGAQMLDD